MALMLLRDVRCESRPFATLLARAVTFPPRELTRFVGNEIDSVGSSCYTAISVLSALSVFRKHDGSWGQTLRDSEMKGVSFDISIIWVKS